jgi:thioester reductase-like protein
VWADTRQGRYDELQEGYRILKSCLMSGCGIENYRYVMPPTPVDYVARAIVSLSTQQGDDHTVYHISSSRQPVGGMFERYNQTAETSLRLLPLYDWIVEIKRLYQEGRILPAVPLVEFAFSMDKASFGEYQRANEFKIQFDCAQTHGVLETAGIVAPTLDDDLLQMSLESMLARDTDLRQLKTSNVYRTRVGKRRV